jgi:hypothetical protein
MISPQKLNIKVVILVPFPFIMAYLHKLIPEMGYLKPRLGVFLHFYRQRSATLSLNVNVLGLIIGACLFEFFLNFLARKTGQYGGQ